LQQEGCKQDEGQELWPKSRALPASFEQIVHKNVQPVNSP
jgi:hypothetical protein